VSHLVHHLVHLEPQAPRRRASLHYRNSRAVTALSLCRKMVRHKSWLCQLEILHSSQTVQLPFTSCIERRRLEVFSCNHRTDMCLRSGERWFDMRLKEGACERCHHNDRNQEIHIFGSNNNIDCDMIFPF
jgi:hypothetical protein